MLVVETPSFSLHRPAYPSAPTGPLTGTGCFGPAFDRSYRQRTAILTLPGQGPAKIPDKPFRNGAGESVPPDGTYVPKKRCILRRIFVIGSLPWAQRPFSVRAYTKGTDFRIARLRVLAASD